ncbi:MAG: dephospho-CoA kinase [candidate division WOR-3 bacterium]
MKVIIGLTGNAGSGKTTVANILREMGFSVVDADKEAHKVLKHPDVIEFLRKKLPEALKNGEVDRKVLGDRVFSDEKFKEEFENLVRPLVIERLREVIQNIPDNVVVVDAALIYEYGVQDAFDIIVVVWAPEEELVKRLVERGIPEEKVKAILKHQIPQEEKLKYADFIIRNYGSIEDVRKQVFKVFRSIMRKLEELEIG